MLTADRAQCAPTWLDELEAGIEAGIEAGAPAGAEAGGVSASPLDMGERQGGEPHSSVDFGLAPISPVGGEFGALNAPKDEGCQSTGGGLPAFGLAWLLLALLALMKRDTLAKLI